MSEHEEETKVKREKFGSRLGFILVSAGCAIGIGNVWKFPYMCGEFGGAAFILIYLVFLLILGIPVLTCEFAIGRGSGRSVAAGFERLEPQGSSWHVTKWVGIIGSYLLMMFYTTVGGWMMYYCYRSIKGEFAGASTETVTSGFTDMLGNAPVMAFWTTLMCVIGFTVCHFGIQKGIERVSKFMMSALLIIMLVLAVHSVFLKGAGEGIRFYLVPNFNRMLEIGIGNVIFGAMSQAFFTLSIGVGAMMIFGSYIGKERNLAGEAISITALDTFVALMAGFLEEANTGKGVRFPEGLKSYISYVLPLIIIVIYLKGYYDKFVEQGTAALTGWMIAAVLFLGFIIACAVVRRQED